MSEGAGSHNIDMSVLQSEFVSEMDELDKFIQQVIDNENNKPEIETIVIPDNPPAALNAPQLEQLNQEQQL